MTKFLLRWIINALAVYLAVLFIPGISYQGGWLGIVWLALILGLLNAFLRPLLQLLTCPLILLTLGLFTLLINTLMFWWMSSIGQAFGIAITVDGFLPAFLGGLIVSVVSIIFSMMLHDGKKAKS
jgi:putative membrane protein